MPNDLTAPLPAQIAEASFMALMRVAEYSGVPESYRMQEVAKIASDLSGIDLTPMLTHAACMNDVSMQDAMMDPTELGKLCGFSSIAMNLALEKLGLQVKKAGRWVPTPEGAKLCRQHAWVKGDKSGYSLKWLAYAIEDLLEERGDYKPAANVTDIGLSG